MIAALVVSHVILVTTLTIFAARLGRAHHEHEEMSLELEKLRMVNDIGRISRARTTDKGNR